MKASPIVPAAIDKLFDIPEEPSESLEQLATIRVKDIVIINKIIRFIHLPPN